MGGWTGRMDGTEGRDGWMDEIKEIRVGRGKE